jgi:glyoxylase-like metal-dependent hydrolase (beta-lactamase superfamily II)
MPNSTETPVYVTVSALDAGHLTLPEHLFVTDADPGKRSTVPSLSFLIQHPSPSPRRSDSHVNLVFDLGIKRDLSGYTPAQRAHIAQRQPTVTDPDCAVSLRFGVSDVHGEKRDAQRQVLLEPSTDIDMVLLSHVHWDHVGTPSDFAEAIFAVGSGTLDLLKNGAGPLYPAEQFNDDELPVSRTVEFPPVPDNEYEAGPYTPKHTPALAEAYAKLPSQAKNWAWRPLEGFPFALDLFGDESVFVVDSPGHLYGHVNLLARLGEHRYVWLGGDCCHDARILSGDKDIAMYEDGRGGMRSVHVDTGVARKTLDRIREFVQHKTGQGKIDVEVVIAHDGVWRERNRHRFWPGKL